MTAKYLLPCSCGRKTPVEPRQAGQLIECPCGAPLQIPTLLKLADLQMSEPESVPRQRSVAWGLRQRTALLGGVILLGAVGTLSYLYMTQPLSSDPNLDPDVIRQKTKGITPLQSRRTWQLFRAKGLDSSPRREDRVFREALLKHRLWMGIGLAVALVGIGLIAAALRPSRRPPAATGPAP